MSGQREVPKFSKMTKPNLVVECQKLFDIRTTIEDELLETKRDNANFQRDMKEWEQRFWDQQKQFNELTDTNTKLAEQVETLIGVIKDMKGGK
jgi:hemerythrin-like domain-containing protein